MCPQPRNNLELQFLIVYRGTDFRRKMSLRGEQFKRLLPCGTNCHLLVAFICQRAIIEPEMLLQ